MDENYAVYTPNKFVNLFCRIGIACLLGWRVVIYSHLIRARVTNLRGFLFSLITECLNVIL